MVGNFFPNQKFLFIFQKNLFQLSQSPLIQDSRALIPTSFFELVRENMYESTGAKKRRSK